MTNDNDAHQCTSLPILFSFTLGGGNPPPPLSARTRSKDQVYNGDTVLEKVVTTYVVVNGQNLVTFLQLSVFTFSHSQYHY